MNQHIRRVYVPLTETAFYILLCLYAWLLALFVFQYRKLKRRK